MANDKTTAAKETPVAQPPKSPSLSDTQARDHFIGVALREIISHHIAEKKWNYDMAATLAVRYANAVMVARAAETAPLKLTVNKGTVAAPVEVAPPEPPATEEGEKPKTIAELIGEQPQLEEVK